MKKFSKSLTNIAPDKMKLKDIYNEIRIVNPRGLHILESDVPLDSRVFSNGDFIVKRVSVGNEVFGEDYAWRIYRNSLWCWGWMKVGQEGIDKLRDVLDKVGIYSYLEDIDMLDLEIPFEGVNEGKIFYKGKPISYLKQK